MFAFRVYKRSVDKIEDQVTCVRDDAPDMKRKFQVACAIIENDPRPIGG